MTASRSANGERFLVVRSLEERAQEPSLVVVENWEREAE